MSLRIRRGSNTSRQSTAFDTGELVWTTDTNKLFVGGVVSSSNLGGINILATSAGTGLVWDATSQTIQFGGLGAYSTDSLPEGVSPSKLYFTTDRARDAVATMFTATGTAVTSGTVVATNVNGTVTLGASVAAGTINPGEKFVLSGAGLPARGLTATTYYVVSASGASVILASTLANALASVAITTISSTGSVSTVNYTAGQTNGIVFTYDSTTKVMSAAATLSGDATPTLGGNLVLNNYNVTGTGNINISGTLLTSGLGGNLILNSNSITGSGNITTTGSITLTVTDQLNPLTIVGTTSGLTNATSSIFISTSRASLTSIANGDLLSQLVTSGYNGTSYKKAFLVQSVVAGSVQGSGNFNTDGSISVLNADGTYKTFAFKSNSLFGTLGVTLTPTSTASIAAAAIGVTGSTVYNSDLLGLQVYTGSAFTTIPTVVSVPSTATSTGTVGQIAFDNSNFYVCTATNVWKRVAISSW